MKRESTSYPHQPPIDSSIATRSLAPDGTPGARLAWSAGTPRLRACDGFERHRAVVPQD